MKKFAAVAVFVAVTALPVFAHAATFVASETYSSRPQDVVSGSLYVAGNSVSVGSAVTGDLLAAGGMVVVTGAVSGDVLAGSGDVQLLAPVQGDVRVAAGQVSINSRINGDLVVLGGSVAILPGATIGGGVTVLGGQTTVDGTVNGSLLVRGGRLIINGTVRGNVDARLDESLTVGPNAIVGGTLAYRAPSQGVIGSGAKIGAISFVPKIAAKAGRTAANGILLALAGVLTATKLLMLLGAAALIIWRWRREALEVLQDAHDRFWGSLGSGIVFGVLVPIGAVLLMISIVGTFAGFAALALYGLCVLVAKVMAGLFLGAWLHKLLRKGATLHLEWLPGLGGVLLLEFLGVVPVVGFLADVVLFLIVFGALARRLQKALV